MSDANQRARLASRNRRRFIGRIAWQLAVRAAPFYQAFYDLQMAQGGVRIARTRLKLEHFPSMAPPLRLAFVSDLHYGPTVGRLAPLQAWRAVRAAKPDVLILGGDYLYGD